MASEEDPSTSKVGGSLTSNFNVLEKRALSFVLLGCDLLVGYEYV